MNYLVRVFKVIIITFNTLQVTPLPYIHKSIQKSKEKMNGIIIFTEPTDHPKFRYLFHESQKVTSLLSA